jgi:formamidopyrimidine-DNA glycosylase
MPELPEVEVTKRYLEPFLVQRQINKVIVSADNYLFLTPPKELKQQLHGRTIQVLERRAKYLLVGLDNQSRILLHLGMTGQLLTANVPSPLRLLSSTTGASLTPEAQVAFRPDEHTHLQLGFSDQGPEVWFRDPRKFGKVKWLKPGASDERLDKLGIDALEADGSELFAAFRKRKIAIKALLLQQTALAGVGNIYADEGLFLAQIHPERSVADVKLAECRQLVKFIQQVMERSIETGGSSISDFVKPDGSQGSYQDERQVYARQGMPCRVCKTTIMHTVVATRSTHYCPKCQR